MIKSLKFLLLGLILLQGILQADTIVRGEIILPSEMSIENDCFDSTCTSVSLILIDAEPMSGEEYFVSLEHNETNDRYFFNMENLPVSVDKRFYVRINIQNGNAGYENLYYDLGVGESLGGTEDNETDVLLHEDEINSLDPAAMEDDPEKITLNPLFIFADTSEIILDIDLSDKDNGRYIISGNIEVESNSEIGTIYLKFVNIYTGEEGVTHPILDENNASLYHYAHSFKADDNNYSVRLDMNYMNEPLRLFFNGVNLITDFNIPQIDVNNDGMLWIADPARTGYVTVEGSVELPRIDFATYAQNMKRVSGIVTPADFMTELVDDPENPVGMINYLRIEFNDALTGSNVKQVPVNCENPDDVTCSYNFSYGADVVMNDLHVRVGYYQPNDGIASINYGYDYGTNQTNGGTGDDADSVIEDFNIEYNCDTGVCIPTYNALAISAAGDTVADINFTGFIPEPTFKVEGGTSAVPDTITGMEVQLREVQTGNNVSYISAVLGGDGNYSFELPSVHNGEYLVYLNLYGDMDSYGFYLRDDDGNFSNGGVTAVNREHLLFVNYDADGNEVEDWDWENTAYTAPQDLSTRFIIQDNNMTISLFDISIDADGDGQNDNEDSDDDNDGIPDSYEVSNGLNPIVDDADGDLDGDGFSNLEEYEAGSNANDASSIPSIRIQGEVTLPDGVVPNCDGMTEPCTRVEVQLLDMSIEPPMWVDGRNLQVDGDGKYTYAFNSGIEINGRYGIEVNIENGNVGNERLYYTFGVDESIGGIEDNETDFFLHQDEVRDYNCMMGMGDFCEDRIEAHPLLIAEDATTITLDLNLTTKDEGRYIATGEIEIEEGFTTQSMNLQFVDIATGAYHDFQAYPDENNASLYQYAHSFKADDNNYSIRLQVYNDGWISTYFNGIELISDFNIPQIDVNNDGMLWIADPARTGYVTVEGSVELPRIDFATYAQNMKRVSGIVTPADFMTELVDDPENPVGMINYLRIEFNDALTGSNVKQVPVNCENPDDVICSYSFSYGSDVVMGDLHVGVSYQNDMTMDNLNYAYDYGTDQVNGGTGDDADSVIEDFNIEYNCDTGVCIPTYNALAISAAGDTVADINFTGFIPEPTFKVEGSIGVVPDTTDGLWIRFSPLNQNVNNFPVNEDKTYSVENLRNNTYIIEVNVDAGEDGYYNFILRDDDGDFSNGGVTAVNKEHLLFSSPLPGIYAPEDLSTRFIIQDNNMTISLFDISIDADGDGQNDNEDSDDDNDGIPDSYEVSNGLNPIVDDADGDLDGDGATNLEEYEAGTSANDANSKPSTIVYGEVILPDSIVPTQNCVDWSSCTQVDVQLIDVDTDQWIDGRSVQLDIASGKYLYELGQGRDLGGRYYVRLYIRNGNAGNEWFYYSLGEDENVSGEGNSLDVLMHDDEARGEWLCDENGCHHDILAHPLAVIADAENILLDINLTNKDEGRRIISGDIKLEEGFVPGAVYDESGNYLGHNSISIDLNNIQTGSQVQINSFIPTELANVYHYVGSFKDTDDANYSVKMRVNELGASTSAYFNGTNLISDFGINRININGWWIPDPEQTGYIEAVGTQVEIPLIDYDIYAQTLSTISGIVTLADLGPLGVQYDEDGSQIAYSSMRVQLHDAINGNHLASAQVYCDGSEPQVCTYSFKYGGDVSIDEVHVRIDYQLNNLNGAFPSSNVSYGYDYGNDHNNSGVGDNADSVIEQYFMEYECTDIVEPTQEQIDRGQLQYCTPTYNTLDITNQDTIADIDFTGFTPTPLYSVSGLILEIPEDAAIGNGNIIPGGNNNVMISIIEIHTGRGMSGPALYDGNSYSFNFSNLLSGEYKVYIDIPRESSSSYHFVLNDNDGNFTNGGIEAIHNNNAFATTLIITDFDIVMTPFSIDVDTDGDGIKNRLDEDDDGDGMTDDYERFYGLDSLSALDRDTDADGDGVSNYDEYMAQTDPTNSDDMPTIPELPRGLSPSIINYILG